MRLVSPLRLWETTGRHAKTPVVLSYINDLVDISNVLYSLRIADDYNMFVSG